MLRIAIVDDEERIRLGLAKLIQQAGEAYEVIGLYSSGQELLDALSESQIDLIITDIKMPQMNGLQLIEKVQQRKPKIKFAIVSGFNDFAFARQALRNGVEDYLLKPVDQNELFQLLQQVKTHVELERYRKTVAVDEHIRLLLRNDIEQLPSHMIQEANRELSQTPLLKDHYAVMILHEEQEVSAERVEKLISGWAREFRILSWEPRQTVIVIAIGSSDHADTAKELGMTLLQKLPAFSKARLGISAINQSALKLRETYRSALGALEAAWYESGTRAFADASHASKRTEEGLQLQRYLDKELSPALHLLDFERVDAILQSWKQDVLKHQLPWFFLRESCSSILAKLRDERRARSLASSDSEEEAERWIPSRFLDWQSFAAEFLAAVNEQLQQLKDEGKTNRVVETVKTYIDKHYKEELELNRLAETVFLTPSYLSKLFKTETGETITDYIISVRIEHAKDQLSKDNGMKTYEIGERVGYPDPAYFNKVFKKIVGMTPKEYRERARR